METKNRYWQDYAKTIEEYPLLSKEEEIHLSNLVRHAKGKSKRDARNKLFCSNIRLVLNIARSYNFNPNDFNDLVNSGCTGLLTAIERFNPRKFNTRFSTYATLWIRLKITRYINDNSSQISIPTHIVFKSHQYKKIQNEDKDMSDKDIMKKLELSERGLKNLRLSQVPVISMDANLTGDDGDDLSLKNVISDKGPAPDAIALGKDNRKYMVELVKELSSVEAKVIVSRYLNDEKDNLVDIGKRLGVTSERVRQIEVKALRKLRTKLRIKYGFKKMGDMA